MSTLKVVNIQHPSAASAALILDSSGNLALPAGSASTPALQGPSDTNTGLFFPTADTIAFAEGGTEALRIDSSGRVGIGTSSPSVLTHLSTSTDTQLRVESTSASGTNEAAIQLIRGSNQSAIKNKAGGIEFFVQGLTNEIARFDSSGRLGIGTTSPGNLLTVSTNTDGTTSLLKLHADADGVNNGLAGIKLSGNAGDHAAYIYGGHSTSGNTFLSFYTDLYAGSHNPQEKMRLDANGRLLVGLSSARSFFSGLDIPAFQVEGTSTQGREISVTSSTNNVDGAVILLGKQRSGTLGGNTIVQNGDQIGYLGYQASDGTNMLPAASIVAVVDATPGTNNMPGRIVFSTTASGASSPTERMRIRSDGIVFIPAAYGATTANAANLNVATDGALQRSTSSIKYKTSVETLQDQYADALLNVRPVWYRSTCPADRPDYGFWGFIAEEVAEIDPRLVHWKTEEITYDEKGSTVMVPCKPEPEGVQYDRFVPHLLNLIKRQKEQIESLEARLSAAGI